MKAMIGHISLLFAILLTAVPAKAKDPVVLVFVIDGLQQDAVEVAAANGAVHLKFLLDNGVHAREAYSTSPAPRMYLPDGSLPWGTSSSPNVAMHTGTHVYESREMDDIFLSARRSKNIKSVFAGGADNYKEFTTPDYSYWGALTDSAVVQHGIDHFKNDGVRLIRLHLQRIRDSWSGPQSKLDPDSEYQKSLLKADQLLGKFMDILKKEGVWDSTYIVVSGDHGMGIEQSSDHPPSVFSSWATFIGFYGPGIKRGTSIPYAETPDIALMVTHFLGSNPLKGHLDPNTALETKGTTATFLENIFEGKPDQVDHPKYILRYLESKQRKPSDEFSEYRSAMLEYIK
jgi:hypothetical protein